MYSWGLWKQNLQICQKVRFEELGGLMTSTRLMSRQLIGLVVCCVYRARMFLIKNEVISGDRWICIKGYVKEVDMLCAIVCAIFN